MQLNLTVFFFNNEKNLFYKNEAFVFLFKILFQNNETLKNEFDYGYYELMNTSDQLQKELLLSLLPQEHTIKSITFSIEYKLIENNNCLIILKDITQIEELELKVQHERQLQKMIIAIVTNKDEAVKLIEDFKKFE